MTQKQKVLGMLKAAGGFGVRSDAYIKEFMPRAAARIQELKDEGYNITSEREGKYTRWTLLDKPPCNADSASIQARRRRLGCFEAPLDTESQVQSQELQVDEKRSVPSMFDPDADWNEAA